MKLFILFSIALSFVLAAESNVPRQKIRILGALKQKFPTALNITDLENFHKIESITVHDPYNNNVKTRFYGFYLKDLLTAAAAKEDFSTIMIKAIDGYQVEITKNDIDSAKLFLSYRDDKGYLTVDRMGPVRIIAPFEGIIHKDLLLKVGVNWVWQVKSIEIKNEKK